MIAWVHDSVVADAVWVSDRGVELGRGIGRGALQQEDTRVRRERAALAARNLPVRQWLDFMEVAGRTGQEPEPPTGDQTGTTDQPSETSWKRSTWSMWIWPLRSWSHGGRTKAVMHRPSDL